MTKPVIDMEWPLRIAERKRFFRIWSGVTLPRAEPAVDPRRLAAAFHEGGHLAAGVIHGAEIRSASIRGGHWHSGEAAVWVPINPDDLDAAWWRAAIGEPIDPLLRDAVEREAYILLAGVSVEVVAVQRGILPEPKAIDTAAPEHRSKYLAAINSGEPKPRGDSGELDELLRRICGDPDEQAAYRRVLERRTEQMVWRHPRYWPLAQAFAAALLERETLDAEAIGAIATEVWRRKQ